MVRLVELPPRVRCSPTIPADVPEAPPVASGSVRPTL